MMLVWFGRASPDGDQQTVEKLANKMKHQRTIKYFDEGQEPDEWFDVLDELPYAKAVTANDFFKHDAVLYSCTCANGWFEGTNFSNNAFLVVHDTLILIFIFLFLFPFLFLLFLFLLLFRCSLEIFLSLQYRTFSSRCTQPLRCLHLGCISRCLSL